MKNRTLRRQRNAREERERKREKKMRKTYLLCSIDEFPNYRLNVALITVQTHYSGALSCSYVTAIRDIAAKTSRLCTKCVISTTKVKTRTPKHRLNVLSARYLVFICFYFAADLYLKYKFHEIYITLLNMSIQWKPIHFTWTCCRRWRCECA